MLTIMDVGGSVLITLAQLANAEIAQGMWRGGVLLNETRRTRRSNRCKQGKMMIEPHWTAYLSALLTPTVALLGIYIAYQQWRISHNKLKLDLFDKRWQIYVDTNDAMVVFLKDSDDSYQHYEKLQRRIMDAQFLCSAETVVFLASVRDRMSKIALANIKYKDMIADTPERESTHDLIVSETEALRSDLDRLVTIFGNELRIKH